MKSFMIVSGELYIHEVTGKKCVELGHELRTIENKVVFDMNAMQERSREITDKIAMFEGLPGALLKHFEGPLTVTNSYVFTVAVTAKASPGGNVTFDIQRISDIPDILKAIAQAKKGGYLSV